MQTIVTLEAAGGSTSDLEAGLGALIGMLPEGAVLEVSESASLS